MWLTLLPTIFNILGQSQAQQDAQDQQQAALLLQQQQQIKNDAKSSTDVGILIGVIVLIVAFIFIIKSN